MTSLSTFFIKGHVGFLQLLKWPCRTSFFTHVEPYHRVAVHLNQDLSFFFRLDKVPSLGTRNYKACFPTKSYTCMANEAR